MLIFTGSDGEARSLDLALHVKSAVSDLLCRFWREVDRREEP